jgi:hypothetical protein
MLNPFPRHKHQNFIKNYQFPATGSKVAKTIICPMNTLLRIEIVKLEK